MEGIKILQKPLSDQLVTVSAVELTEVDWLQVGSNSFLEVKRIDHPLTDGKPVQNLFVTEVAETAGRCFIPMDDPC